MHRILLFALVFALLFLAWDTRKGYVLAGGKQSASSVQAVPTASDEARTPQDADTRLVIQGAFAEPALQDRLDARVEARPDVWAQFELETPIGPRPEVVLADAEAWMAANFPEGGATLEADAPKTAAAPDGLAIRMGMAADGADGAKRSNPTDPDSEPAPIYVASLARIEGLSGDMPAWFGLLDMALQPAGHSSIDGYAAGPGELEIGDTAWISDERGNLVARVRELDGLGFELDPSWPWSARQRRILWTDSGIGDLGARQYRLILQGNAFVPSWSGRLVLIRSGVPYQGFLPR